jgi:LPS export ABC transporter permease LptF
MSKRRPAVTITWYFLKEALPYATLAFLVLTLLIAIQQLGRQASISVLAVATPAESAKFILLVLPAISLITLPIAVLIGVLIALNRLKADSELTTAQACGLSTYALYAPFFILGAIATIVAVILALDIVPRTIRTVNSFRTTAVARGLTAQIRPQVFENRFPGYLVFIEDINKSTGDWLGVFVLKQTSDTESLLLTAERGTLRITETPAIALEIELANGVSFLATEDANKGSIASFDRSFFRLSAAKDLEPADSLGTVARVQSLRNRELLAFANASDGQTRRQALVEWQKRLSVPFASLVLTLIAVAIGHKSHKPRSKSIGIALGFSIAVVYYLFLTAGQNLALSGIVPTWAGAWFPPLASVGVAILILTNTLRFPSLPSFSLVGWKRRLRIKRSGAFARPSDRVRSSGGYSLPRISTLINYLLTSEIIRYFLLGSLILVATTLIFTLFDLIPSISRNRVSVVYAGAYFLFLAPQVLYVVAPFALVTATIGAYFVLLRSNQIVILSASGLSLLRLALPVFALTGVIAATLYMLSDRILPATNREQDARYHEIKGRKIEQAALAFGRRWAYGNQNSIFGFLYSNRDKRLLNTYVYQLNPETRLLEEVRYLSEAVNKGGQTWEVSGGWRYSLGRGVYNSPPQPIAKGTTLNLPEGSDTFSRTVNESSKLSFQDLRAYIRQLDRLGIATFPERIDLWKRLSHPVSCITLILLAMPWVIARRAHTRKETLAGVGIGIVISILYWLLNQGFEVLGRQELLPVWIAVWGGHLTSWALAGYMWGRRVAR